MDIVDGRWLMSTTARLPRCSVKVRKTCPSLSESRLLVGSSSKSNGASAHDEVVNAGGAARCLEFLVGGIGLGDEEVVANAVMEQVRVLLDERLGVAQGARGDPAHIVAGKSHTALVHVPKAHEQTTQRRLSRARSSLDAHNLARLDGYARIVQDLLFIVGEVNMLGSDAAKGGVGSVFV